MKKQQKLLSIIIASATLLFCNPSYSGMTLNANDSTVNFLSIKKGTAAETHTFKEISGSISDSGDVTIFLHLDSVETKIPIRNERLRSILFETANFSRATIKAKIDPNITEGMLKTFETTASLNLHGITKEIKIIVSVLKAGNTLLVASKEPVIIKAQDYGLRSAIETLRKIAKLSSIAVAVPVNFNLTFNE